MKLSIGLVVKDFVSPAPLDKFLDNAKKYGHQIHSVIVAYSCRIDWTVVEYLRREAPVYTVKINGNTRAEEEFKKRGVSEKSAETLLRCDVLDDSGLVPYGFNRNTVLIEAMLSGADALVFVDSDVLPGVLTYKDGGAELMEVDFFGSHLEQLQKGAAFTTSDYSGYNILPPASFDGMDDLLIGLQKEEMIPYWRTSGEHGCLALQDSVTPEPNPSSKALGGNLGILITGREAPPPFFSPHYYIDGTLYLARGEDTIISRTAANGDKLCIDIDTHIFHDTYGDYPRRPDIKTAPAIQNRFFYACTGWIGRNPFLNYLNGMDLKLVRERQAYYLARGAKALSEYTANPSYNMLPEALEISWDSLPGAVDGYTRTLEAWDEFTERSVFNCAY